MSQPARGSLKLPLEKGQEKPDGTTPEPGVDSVGLIQISALQSPVGFSNGVYSTEVCRASLALTRMDVSELPTIAPGCINTADGCDLIFPTMPMVPELFENAVPVSLTSARARVRERFIKK